MFPHLEILVDMLLYDCWDERCHASAEGCITLQHVTASLLAHLKEDELQGSNSTGNYRVKEIIESV